MKKYITPELISEKLQELDVITASGDESIEEQIRENVYFSIMNLFN